MQLGWLYMYESRLLRFFRRNFKEWQEKRSLRRIKQSLYSYAIIF